MKTAEEILEEMKNLFYEKTGTEIRDDSDMGVRMTAAASQVESLYVYNDWVLRQCFPTTATGEHLDMHGGIRGVERKKAAKSTGEISFSIKSVKSTPVEIPSGTVCTTAGGIAFITTADGVIEAGQKVCSVPAEAILSGIQGNVQAQTVKYMTAAPVGVEECTNVSAFSGGKDAESDEAYRERILNSFKRLANGANAAWYEKTVSEIDGVAAVSVVPKSRGLGTVDIIIAGENGIPTDELIEKVADTLNETREICVDILVKAPETLALNITVKVKAMSGYDANAVKNNVNAAIKGLFGGERLGKKLFRAEIADAVYHTEGVANYEVISPDFDYFGLPGVLLVPGTVAVQDW